MNGKIISVAHSLFGCIALTAAGELFQVHTHSNKLVQMDPPEGVKLVDLCSGGHNDMFAVDSNGSVWRMIHATNKWICIHEEKPKAKTKSGKKTAVAEEDVEKTEA